MLSRYSPGSIASASRTNVASSITFIPPVHPSRSFFHTVDAADGAKVSCSSVFRRLAFVTISEGFFCGSRKGRQVSRQPLRVILMQVS